MPDTLSNLVVTELVDGAPTGRTSSPGVNATNTTFPNPIPDNAVYRVTGTTTTSQTITGDSQPLHVSGASGSVAWSKRIGGPGTDYAMGVATDAAGSIFVTGVFSGTCDFAGDGSAVLTSAGGYDVFVAKYTPAGALLWVKQFGVAANSEAPKAIAVAASGNIYVSGALDGGSLMKLNNLGVRQWIKGPNPTNLGGANNQLDFASIAIDSAERIVVGGSFVANYLAPIDFGDNHPLISSAGSTDAFLAQYNSDGTCLWAKNFYNMGDTEFGTGVAIGSSDSIFLLGYAFAGINLGGAVLINGGYGAYGFLGKFQSDGSHVWSRTIGTKLSSDPSYAYCRAKRLGISADGLSLFVSGEWNYVANFGGGSRSASAPFNNLFLAKYRSADGEWVWDKPINGNYGGSAGSVVTDSDGNVLITGQFSQTYNFGGQTLTAAQQPGTFTTGDVYVAKYNTGGALLWASRLGGTDNDSGTSIAVISSLSLVNPKHPVVCGSFNRNVDGSSPTFGTFPMPNMGGIDGFLTALKP